MGKRIPWASLTRAKAAIAWRRRQGAAALELLREARVRIDALIAELEAHAPREPAPRLPLEAA